MGRAFCGQKESEQWVILSYRCSRLEGHTHVGGGDPPAMEYCSSSALLHLSHRLLQCTYLDNVYIMMNIIKPTPLIIQGVCRFILRIMSLYCHTIWLLGGFLLIEHSCDYPIHPACTPGMKYYLGALCSTDKSFLTLVIGLEARCIHLKTWVILPFKSATSPRLTGMTRRTFDKSILYRP